MFFSYNAGLLVQPTCHKLGLLECSHAARTNIPRSSKYNWSVLSLPHPFKRIEYPFDYIGNRISNPFSDVENDVSEVEDANEQDYKQER